ncbi:MAG: CPBP family intramembrane glutamic endopeptidase [Sphingobacterium composti]|uniref:CPBP family intramembrane glutamic endopeptidase n=1 Tax=Sphingobacterium composti TaxID=363260 RepID=UPI00135AD8C1|nr:CPBP family intramembrane glutamic endopeptidase [Sphingobacterium composti Ten et al. 2007 non Yoo et al. 2007]
MTKSNINIIIFIIVALTSGWIGILVDSYIEPTSEAESLGMGIWLVLPLIAVILLRTFTGDGWRKMNISINWDNNIKWYIASLLIYPLVTATVIFIGTTIGWMSLNDFRADSYTQGFLVSLIPNFIKNTFEESVWRGYLTSKLIEEKTSDFWLYLIVGSVWGAWHIPYYLYFLPENLITQILSTDRFSFTLVAILSMICWAVMFVEIYRLTQSIWPVVILHTIEDSVINHLIIDNHITINAGKEILISPISGIITTTLYLGVGLYLRKLRIKSKITYTKQNI